MNIAQISTLTGRGAGLLSRMLEIDKLLGFADFKLDASTHQVSKDSNTHTGSAARAEGTPASRDNQKPTFTSRNLALYTREISIDEVRLLDVNVGMAPTALKLFADRRLNGLAGKLADEIVYDMLNGTDADNKMLGILEFVKDAAAAGQTARLGFTAAELADMNLYINYQLNTTDNQDLFIELLTKEMANVPGANAIICNTNLASRLTTIARRIHAYGSGVDAFGQPVHMFNNVPIVPVSVSQLSQTQSDGANNDCTSLIITRFSEELGTTFSTNSGFYFVDFNDVDTTPTGVSRLSMYLNLTVERTDALRRISRIRL